MPDILIREPIASDAVAMSDYMADLLGEDLGTVLRRAVPTPEEEAEFIAKMASSERAFILVAVDGDRVVGLLDLQAGAREHERHAARFGMSVAKHLRGQGIGRRMLDEMIAKTKAWPGFCRIELEVVPHNTSAIRLYETSGFEIEARKVKAVNLNGQPEDLLLMALVW